MPCRKKSTARVLICNPFRTFTTRCSYTSWQRCASSGSWSEPKAAHCTQSTCRTAMTRRSIHTAAAKTKTGAVWGAACVWFSFSLLGLPPLPPPLLPPLPPDLPPMLPPTETGVVALLLCRPARELRLRLAVAVKKKIITFEWMADSNEFQLVRVSGPHVFCVEGVCIARFCNVRQAYAAFCWPTELPCSIHHNCNATLALNARVSGPFAGILCARPAESHGLGRYRGML